MCFCRIVRQQKIRENSTTNENHTGIIKKQYDNVNIHIYTNVYCHGFLSISGNKLSSIFGFNIVWKAFHVSERSLLNSCFHKLNNATFDLWVFLDRKLISVKTTLVLGIDFLFFLKWAFSAIENEMNLSHFKTFWWITPILDVIFLSFLLNIFIHV